MLKVSELLQMSKTIASHAGLRLIGSADPLCKDYKYCEKNPKEVKAFADRILEEDILNELKKTGLPILSEESGLIDGVERARNSQLRFIIDPLDGTYNYIKELGPCAISIGLWDGGMPIWGVVFDLGCQHLFWGGKDIGAFCNDQPITVSSTLSASHGAICTGFPVRFDLECDKSKNDFWGVIKPFSKVRMFGSAAMSLISVAKGAADAYCEKDIMIWDVAAGLAIVEGAKGCFSIEPGKKMNSLNVFASTPALFSDRG